MSVPVIGVDFGNDNCYIAAARARGLEVITNDYSLRDTPSCVAFNGRNRLMGTGAKNQMITNLKNTFHSFKRLLGRPVDDPFVQQEMKFITYSISRSETEGIAVNIDFAGQQEQFSIEQVASMLFTKLKQIAEEALESKIGDCVITTPTFTTDSERRALISAANIAGLNVLKLMNEPTAVALCYGLYRQNFPAPDQPPRKVVFVDFGHSALQASICHFNQGALKMVAYTFDAQLGGRDFDHIIADRLIEEFNTKYSIDVRSNKRAHLRLLTECEKLKKNMSVNSSQLPLSIECFMDDKDVSASMKRADFEELSAPLFQRVEAVFRELLEVSGMTPQDIDEVEIVGGTTRIPAVKQLIQTVFEKHPSTTLNQDEAVCRGAALQAAMLSPSFRVREFSIIDLQPYPIKVFWQNLAGIDTGEMELYTKFSPVPSTKMMTLKRKEPIFLRALYADKVPYSRKEIAEFLIQDVKASSNGEAQKVKIKIEINSQGVFNVVSSTLYEQKVCNSSEMETDQTEPEKTLSESQEHESMDTDQVNSEETKKADQANSEETKKAEKTVVTKTELKIESRNGGISKAQVDAFADKEAQLIAHDREERDRQNSKNALEEYVYDTRNRVSDESDLQSYLAEEDKKVILNRLEETESWLYEEGDDCQKVIYNQKMEGLRQLVDPVKDRKTEFDLLRQVVGEFNSVLERAQEFVDRFNKGDEQYNHLDSTDVQKVETAIKEKRSWVDQRLVEISDLPKTANVPASLRKPVFISELQSFNLMLNTVMHKPKPKVPTKEGPPQETSPADPDCNQQPSDTAQEKMDQGCPSEVC